MVLFPVLFIVSFPVLSFTFFRDETIPSLPYVSKIFVDALSRRCAVPDDLFNATAMSGRNFLAFTVNHGMDTGQPSRVVEQWLLGAKSIVVLTGAGMSAESGIPTFRDAKNGLWSRFDPHVLASAAAYRDDKALVWGWYVWRMATVRNAQPHAGHRALAKLSALKPGLSVVTQNVDDLHERVGNVDVIHLHGSLFASRCFACARPAGEIDLPSNAVDEPTLRLAPPRRTHCGGSIRPGVVWFGEQLPQGQWKRAEDAVRRCDLLLAVGTSGVVYPAASLPGIAKSRGAHVVEINPVATELSDMVDLVWRTTAGEGLSTLVSRLEDG